jgi:quinol monooxygenase YgiN
MPRRLHNYREGDRSVVFRTQRFCLVIGLGNELSSSWQRRRRNFFPSSSGKAEGSSRKKPTSQNCRGGLPDSRGVAKAKQEGPAYIAKSRREPGNIQYQLQFDASDSGHIFWCEQYASAEAFETHLNSSYSKAWVEMLKPLPPNRLLSTF